MAGYPGSGCPLFDRSGWSWVLLLGYVKSVNTLVGLMTDNNNQ